MGGVMGFFKGRVIFEGGLGTDRVEVDEPGLEERPRHLFQRLVHAPVQLDLVVQRAEDVGDGVLILEGRNHETKPVKCLKVDVVLYAPSTDVFVLELIP